MRISDILSLDRQYTFYKAYHSNPINRRIHTLGVPLILISALSLLSRLRLPPPLVDSSRLVTAFYIAYYIALDPSLGLAFAPFLLLAHALSVALCRYAGPSGIVPWALVLQVMGWGAQIVGHYAFEGRSPAFMDSAVQAFLGAPILVWLEALFACGLLSDTRARLMRSRVVAKARKAVAQNQS